MGFADPVMKVSALILIAAIILGNLLWTPKVDTPVLKLNSGDGTVVVTGASHFIAEHVIAKLLQQGYAVRGTVPSLEGAQHLKRLFPSVPIYEIPTSDPTSYKDVFENANYVIHAAHVEAEEDASATSSAQEDTENVLKAAEQTPSIKRVILTAALPHLSHLHDLETSSSKELDWELHTETFVQRALRNFYRLAHRRYVELVTLHPTLVFGSPLTNTSAGEGVALIKGFLEGAYVEGAPAQCHALVDASDVATAHLVALQSPEAPDQRFLLTSSETYSTLQLAQLLTYGYQDWPLPTKEIGSPLRCPQLQASKALTALGLKFRPVASEIPEVANRMSRLGMVQRPSGWKPPLGAVLAVALRKAFWRALGGGLAGALAMVIQVFSLMWLRTTMNYQYRYGHTTWEAISILYNEGGISRFYRGLLPALLQGPLSRFCDTAANTGVLALVAALPLGPALSSYGVSTLAASAAASSLRIALMPIDALKTIMQVEGKNGVSMLLQKISDNGIGVLYAGTLAQMVAGFVGHYPWYLTFNWLDDTIAPGSTHLQKIVRNALIGVVSTINSDVCSNGLRVIKTAVQTHPTPIGYWTVVSNIWREEGATGFLRGLKTRMLTNILQGAMFSVMWRILMEAI